MDWNAIRSDFIWDGSLRDIYVLGTDEPDWQRLLDYLHESSLLLRFTIDGVPANLPKSVGDIFRQRQEGATSLAVDWAGLILGCHFFWSDAIEFDLDPREVRSETLFRELLNFMSTLAELLNKTTILTFENAPDEVILRILPNQEALHGESE